MTDLTFGEYAAALQLLPDDWKKLPQNKIGHMIHKGVIYLFNGDKQPIEFINGKWQEMKFITEIKKRTEVKVLPDD